jgi:hypothetical protein
LVPTCYEFNHIPSRSDTHGSGIGIMYISGLPIALNKFDTNETYPYAEKMDCTIHIEIFVYCHLILLKEITLGNKFL